MFAASRRLQIESLVRDALCRAGLDRPPVDLDQLARSVGVTSVDLLGNDAMEGLLGRMTPRPDGFHIRLNRDVPARLRFTFAHEIAHTLLAPRIAGNRAGLRESTKFNATERLCDQIASEILMPTGWFRAKLADRPLSVQHIVELSRLFDTSVQAAAIRMTREMGTYIEVICWEKQPDCLSVSWRAGAPKLTARSGSPLQLSLDDESNGPVRAWSTGRPVVVPAESMGRRFISESCVFGDSAYRYVLTLVKPMASETEVLGAQIASQAMARRQQIAEQRAARQAGLRPSSSSTRYGSDAKTY